MRKKEVKLNN